VFIPAPDRNRKRKGRDANASSGSKVSTPKREQTEAEAELWRKKYADLQKKYEKVQTEFGELQQTWVMDKLPALSIETPSPGKKQKETDDATTDAHAEAMFAAWRSSPSTYSGTSTQPRTMALC
jgi:hypothetical protein